MHKVIHFLSRKEGLFLMLAVLVGGAAMWVSFSLAAATQDLLPSGNGYYSGWKVSASSGANQHYTLVDDSTCNGNTDYVYSGIVGTRDSYLVNINSIPYDATINSIKITPCASTYSSGGLGTTKIETFFRFNNTDYSVKEYSFGSSAGATPTSLVSGEKTGLSLVKTADSKLDVGVFFKSGGTSIKLSRISTAITYTNPYPTNLTATLSCSATGAPQIVLGWTDNSSSEDKFEIMRGGTDLTTVAPYTSVGSNVTTYIDQSVDFGTEYNYKVNSVKDGVYSYYSNMASFFIPSASESPCASVSVPPTVSTPPVTDATPTSTPISSVPQAPSVTVDQHPTNLTATLTCSTTGTPMIVLNWNDNSTDEDRFQIMRNYPFWSPTMTDLVTIDTVNSNVATYLDQHILLGKVYSYEVNAVKYNTGGYALGSNVVTVTVPSTSPCAPIATPPAPTLGSTGQIGVVVSSTCAFSAVVTWTDNSIGETGFKVYRQLLPSGSTPLTSFTTGPNVTRYADTTVTPGKSYSYFVSAFYNTTFSEATNSTSVSIPLCPQ